MAMWTVTVTSPGSGRVDTVEVPASCERAAFPTACAWYPQLPLTGAHVEVVEVAAAPAPGWEDAPASTAGREASQDDAGRGARRHDADDAAGDAGRDASREGAVAVAARPSRLHGAA
jgi:hypothetical protein